MDIKKKRIKTIVTILIFIILLLLFWIVIGGRSFAKYKNEIHSSHTAEIAKTVFIVDGAQNIQIDGKEDTIYAFEIKNFDETGVNQVGLNYDIAIVNHSEADLEFELMKNGELIELNEDTTNLFYLGSYERQIDKYELKIKYHHQPTIISDIEGNVQIKAQATQAQKDG